MSTYEEELRDSFLYYRSPESRPKRPAPSRSSLQLRDFLSGLLQQIEEDAPEWSSDPQPPYNFSASEEYASAHFPKDLTQDEFETALISAVHECANSGTYTNKAYGAWMLGVLANVLAKQGQDNVILERIVTRIWEERLAKDDPFSIADFINPGILDVVYPSPARDAFLSRIVTLITERTHDTMRICGFNTLLDHSVRIGAHLGDYNFEDEKTEIARALVDTMGPRELIAWCRHGSHIKFKISFLDYLLCRERPERVREIAHEIVEQVPADVLARNILDIFTQDVDKAGSFPRAAMRFFPSFMNALDDDKKAEYGAAVLKKFGPEKIVLAMNLNLSWMGFNESIRGFIDAFPQNQAEAIVALLTDAALSRDYAVPPERYNENPDMYWEYAKYAISVHDIIPEKCLAFYEKRIMDFLSQKEAPDHAIVTASILLRGPLTKGKEHIQTQEVDFYPTQTFTTTGAMAHIKPRKGQNTEGTVTTGFFIGTLSEYFGVLAPPPQGAPRYFPPNGTCIDRAERHAAFSNKLRTAETDAQQGREAGLPSLKEFLRSRQPTLQLASK